MAPDGDMDELYERLVAGLNDLGLVCIHVVDHSSMGAPAVSPALKAKIRATFNGKYILSGGYDLARANDDLDANRGDLVAFGRLFIANADLVRDLESGHPLTAPDAGTFYTAGEKGYTDY
jgi:N-ethylmaleimide reductase